MKKVIILLILLAVVVFTAGCTEATKKNSTDPPVIPNNGTEGAQKNSTDSQGTQEKGAVVELTQLEQINTYLQKGPVFVKLGAEWCGPCKEMKPILSELATEYEGKATIMSADVDNSPKLADYYGANVVPVSFVVKGIENGEYVYLQQDGNFSKDRFNAKVRIIGFMDKEAIKNILDLAIQKAKST
jgi:thiol-disulfide isomerase/thioredoxin